ncbi:hypothetical protein ALC60_10425 [Trachymyrmex zeteki]|uniref:Uncharacterized protein n=1 Tax=Mycetomoellerius zeteki TaxID=64791 RepID=A0A151WS78_9HYME|nr:hypothetical protein ALC60_10425 [Trachymyrmex zeteki]
MLVAQNCQVGAAGRERSEAEKKSGEGDRETRDEIPELLGENAHTPFPCTHFHSQAQVVRRGEGKKKKKVSRGFSSLFYLERENLEIGGIICIRGRECSSMGSIQKVQPHRFLTTLQKSLNTRFSETQAGTRSRGKEGDRGERRTTDIHGVDREKTVGEKRDGERADEKETAGIPVRDEGSRPEGSVGRLACLLTRALACGYVRSSPILILLSLSLTPGGRLTACLVGRSVGRSLALGKHGTDTRAQRRREMHEKEEKEDGEHQRRRQSSNRGAKATEKGERLFCPAAKTRKSSSATRRMKKKERENEEGQAKTAPLNDASAFRHEHAKAASQPGDRPTDRPGSSQPSSRPGHYDCQANANWLCIINGPRATAGRGSHDTRPRIYSTSPRSATRIFIIFHWVSAKRAHQSRRYSSRDMEKFTIFRYTQKQLIRSWIQFELLRIRS